MNSFVCVLRKMISFSFFHLNFEKLFENYWHPLLNFFINDFEYFLLFKLLTLMLPFFLHFEFLFLLMRWGASLINANYWRKCIKCDWNKLWLLFAHFITLFNSRTLHSNFIHNFGTCVDWYGLKLLDLCVLVKIYRNFFIFFWLLWVWNLQLSHLISQSLNFQIT